ncbi:uncharacterized protein RCC_04473 [Ramularia collo-cygni]|uniref:Uncharacterized protein n=1 Tax=Ramularia collo-cygni TaxID=112498 RepID=A0A2D3VAQ7_9PEZI|nr:uncharacterized protein RCC_04473 [Ramularia collo-cygni]CZT18629.1 uncharacterized protein RCC_04473 [Ramularia collo-cygni]
MLTHVLQNQHVRRAWRFLRPGNGAEQCCDAEGLVLDAKHPSTVTSESRPENGSSTSRKETAKANVLAIDPSVEQDTAHDPSQDAPVEGMQPLDEPTGCAREGEPTDGGYEECELVEEAEEDYTNGPCRLMAVPDAGKISVALMLKFDLSGRIQEAIQAQRLHQRKQTHTELQLAEIERFEDTLHDVMGDKECRLAAEDGGEESEDDDIAPLRRELEILQILVDNTKMRKKVLNNQFQWCSEDLLERHAAVMEYLNAAFTRALLVEPGDEPTEPIQMLDLEQEYQQVHKALYGDNEAGSEDYVPEPMTVEDPNMYINDIATQSPEEVADSEMNDAIWKARMTRDEAERHFNSRGDRRDQEWQDHRMAEFNGLPTRDSSAEEFDLRWVVEDRLTTRALIEAEENLMKAKAAAVDAGIEVIEPEDDIPEWQYECPGHHLSGEKEVGIIIPNARIEIWRNTVTELAEPGKLHEDDAESAVWAVHLDFWESREVEMGDSGSCVDIEWYPEEIAKWQKALNVPRIQRSNSI